MLTLYCPSCGCNLTGLSEDICPECGEGFDREELIKRQENCISNRSVLLQLTLVPLATAVVLLLVLMIGIVSSSGGGPGLVVALLLIPMVVVVANSMMLGESVIAAWHARAGRLNTPWIFRSVVPCFFLFAAIEFVLTLVYMFGGCVGVLVIVEFY